MSARLRVRLVAPQDDGKGGIEWRVDVCDPALCGTHNAGTDERLRAIWDAGEDYFCVYGPTALDAIREGVDSVHSGEAKKYFDDVRQAYGVTA